MVKALERLPKGEASNPTAIKFLCLLYVIWINTLKVKKCHNLLANPSY